MSHDRKPERLDPGVATSSQSPALVIESVDAQAIRIPIETPTALSTRTLSHREYVLARVRTADRLEGTGYTYAGTSSGTWLRDSIRELIAPVLKGRPVLDREANWDAIYREFLLIGRSGALIRALSAVDIAAWDLLGRANEMPLRALLGGTAERVPAYASGGYYRPGNAVENVVSEMGRYRKLGFVDFKMKIGRLPLKEDIARVAAARQTIGPHCRLALDANNAWRYVHEARYAIDAFAEFDIWWIEEPLMPDDVAGHAVLVRNSRVPIATGEIEATRWGFGRLIRERAADILQPDACVCGGISEWLKIAHAASMVDLPVASHWHANLHAQLASAITNALPVEYFALEENIYNFEHVVANRLTIEDGTIVLDQTPGIGVQLDDDAVQEALIE